MTAGLQMMTWTIAAPAISAAFLASLVEAVEALTIVLAVGTVRGWRPAGLGVLAGIGVLALIVVSLGPLLDQFCTKIVLYSFVCVHLHIHIINEAGHGFVVGAINADVARKNLLMVARFFERRSKRSSYSGKRAASDVDTVPGSQASKTSRRAKYVRPDAFGSGRSDEGQCSVARNFRLSSRQHNDTTTN